MLYVDCSGISEKFQSGLNHTAAQKVFNDLLSAADPENSAVLLLFDSTSSFDTVDAQNLL